MIYFISSNKDLFHSTSITACGMDKLTAWLNNREWFGCDTETEGMFDFKNKIIMLQIGDFNDQFVIDTRNTNVSVLKPYFENEKYQKIFHNAKFDLRFLRFSFGFTTENVYDTFLAECCLTNGIKDRSLGLDKVVYKYCGNSDIDKSERGKFVNLQGRPFTESQIVYGADDIKYLSCVKDEQQKEINQWGLQPVIDLENEVVITFSDIEYNGACLNVPDWLELAQKAKSRMVESESILDGMIEKDSRLKSFVKVYIQGDLFGEEPRKIDIQWSSPTQVTKVFKKLGLEIDSSGALEIAKHQNKEPIVKSFLDYKKEAKLTTTYGTDFLKFINPQTGRIHCEYWQILETHRVSSNKPNLQQLPNRPEYLACIIAPQGMKVVGADFSKQELNLIAEGSKDPVWIDALNNKEDLHAKVASMVFGIPVEDTKKHFEKLSVGGVIVYLRGKTPRDIAKTINFMLAYGGSEFKLADTLGISVDSAKAIIESYFAAVPKVRSFLQSCADYGVKNKCMRSFRPYSIVRHFAGYDMSDRKQRGEVERMSKNTIIQAGKLVACLNPFNCWKPEMVISSQLN